MIVGVSLFGHSQSEIASYFDITQSALIKILSKWDYKKNIVDNLRQGRDPTVTEDQKEAIQEFAQKGECLSVRTIKAKLELDLSETKKNEILHGLDFNYHQK